jgi:hypothetical protein
VVVDGGTWGRGAGVSGVSHGGCDVLQDLNALLVGPVVEAAADVVDKCALEIISRSVGGVVRWTGGRGDEGSKRAD